MAEEDQNNQKQVSALSEITKTLKEANNVLIIISRDPSIDQLSASIGLTLALNRDDKHATAVFSGQIPPIIEFLEPHKTLEKNTDSLRDFIISLDKSKADKLRYKVEDSVVKIFITPYRTSISDADLEFSQGDFNVDAVIALGIQNKGDLDEAIVAHGRILHDATIVSVSTKEASELGSIQWVEHSASSLSEMATDLVSALDKKLIDSQIATALLTGIVYETDRFRNEKSSPHTMAVSGILMEAGASTQLVATKLEEPHEEVIDESGEEIPEIDEEAEPEQEPVKKPSEPGLIEIEHDDDQIRIDDSGKLRQISEILDEVREENENKQQNPPPNDPTTIAPQSPNQISGAGMVLDPPQFGGQLTANTTQVDQQYVSNPDPLTVTSDPIGDTLSHNSGHNSGPSKTQTLSDLERSVNSPHVTQQYQSSDENKSHAKTIQPLSSLNSFTLPPESQVDYAQTAVERAVASSTNYKPEPISALGSQPLGADLGHPEPTIIKPDNFSGGPPPPVPPPMFPLS